MVAKTTSGSDNPTSSTMAATYLDSSAVPSWGTRYGREKLHTYRNKYGKITTFDSPSTVFKGRSEFDLSSRRKRGSYFDDETRVTSGGRSRVVRSEDRDVNLEITRSNRLLQSSHRYDYKGRRYVDEDKENVSVKRFGLLPSRRFGRSASVDRDAMMEVDLDLKRERKSSRFLDTYSNAAIKRKVEQVYDRRHSVELSDYEARRSRLHSSPRSSDFYSLVDGGRRVPRATSLSRFDDEPDIGKILSRSKRSASVSRFDDEEWQITPKKTHMGEKFERELAGDIEKFQSHRDGSDLSTYVMDPNSRFEPDNVHVVQLPSGKRAVTLTKFKQSGSGDQKEANAALNRVVEKTRYMQQSMSSLEDFVRRNRSMFPEDTRIYQRVRYFQLNEQQLAEIGEPPDAEVFGVKIAEKLVVPPGTDVAHLLNRYYGKREVEIEYDEKVSRRQEEEERMETDYQQMQDDIRQKVEKEFECREKKRILGDESYEVKRATAHTNQHENYGHMHSYLTPNYIQSIYRDAGVNYDDIYQTRSRYSSYASSITSDQESTRSSLSSRRRKRFDAAPTFTAKLRPKRCHLGQTIRFNCSVSGLPMPEVQWLHGTRLVTDGGHYNISNNYGLLSLEIVKVTKENAGLYTVKATNLEGEVACSASLEVHDWSMDEEKGEGTRKPYFVMEAANAWAEKGNKATIEAQATGRPMPSFRWLKDNIVVNEDNRIRMFSDERGNAKLIIRDIQPSDAGLYFCVAESKAGKVKCAATLRVVERGQIIEERRRSRSRSREPEPIKRTAYSRETTPRLDLGPPLPQGTKPWFIQTPPSEVKVIEGDPLTLRCIVDGDPKPMVTWYKGVREMTYTKRHRILVEGTNHYLFQIVATLQTDPGQYIVVAENNVGKCQASVWVNVLPRDTTDTEDWEIRRLRLELPQTDWEVSSTGSLGRTPPKFIKKLPLETEVSPGLDLEIKCMVTEEEPALVTTTQLKTTTAGEAKLTEEIVKISTKTEDKTQGDDVSPSSEDKPDQSKQADEQASKSEESEKSLAAAAAAEPQTPTDSAQE